MLFMFKFFEHLVNAISMGLFPDNVPTSIHEYLFGKELVCWVSLTGMSREVGFYFNIFYIFHFFKSCILVSYCRLII
jgi:hypothetical protein